MNSPTSLTILSALCLGAAPVFAEETVSEKAAVVKNDAVRATKKVVHRAKELICAKKDRQVPR